MVKPQFEVGKERRGRRRRRPRPGAAGRGRARRWPRQAGTLGLGVRGRDREPAARARPATSSTSCGCERGAAAARRPAEVDRAVAEGPAVTETRRPVLVVAHTGRPRGASRSAQLVVEPAARRRASRCGCWRRGRRPAAAPGVDGRCRPPARAAEGAELVIVLGGDGTLLRGRRARPAVRRRRCSASTSATSASSPRPSGTTWPPRSTGSWHAATTSRSG